MISLHRSYELSEAQRHADAVEGHPYLSVSLEVTAVTGADPCDCQGQQRGKGPGSVLLGRLPRATLRLGRAKGGGGAKTHRKTKLLKFRRVTIRGAQPSARLSEEICLSEGSTGVSQRALRGLCEGSAGSLRGRGIFRGFSGVVTLCL